MAAVSQDCPKKPGPNLCCLPFPSAWPISNDHVSINLTWTARVQFLGLLLVNADEIPYGLWMYQLDKSAEHLKCE